MLKFNSTSPRSFSPGCLYCLNECGATDWHSSVVNQLLKEFSGAFTLPHVIFSSEDVHFTSVRISIRMQVTENTQQLLCVWLFWVTAVQCRDKNRLFLLSTTPTPEPKQLQMMSWIQLASQADWEVNLVNCPADLSTRHKLAMTTMPDAGVCNKNLQGQIKHCQYINKNKKIPNKSKQSFTMPSENQRFG